VGSRILLKKTEAKATAKNDLEPLKKEKKLDIVQAIAFVITGIVMDDKGEPLVGASVVLEGTTKGTITDENGKYKLELDAKEEKTGRLVFSYVGYDSQTMPILGQNVINITLSEGKALGEVVVIGYGTQKRSDVTGSVAKYKNESLMRGLDFKTLASAYVTYSERLGYVHPSHNSPSRLYVLAQYLQ
jgi:hypothetical protein